MALTKLDPTVIGQDSTGAGKITSAGGSVSIDSSGNVRIANSTANSITFASTGHMKLTAAGGGLPTDHWIGTGGAIANGTLALYGANNCGVEVGVNNGAAIVVKPNRETVLYGNTISGTDAGYDLGGPSNRWRNIYISGFVTKSALDGSDPLHAGTSASAIKALTGTTTDGMYWLKPSGGSGQAFLAYCIMSRDGGGWVKVLQFNNATSMATTDFVNYNGQWCSQEINLCPGKISTSDWNALNTTNSFLFRVKGGSDNLLNSGAGTGKLAYTGSLTTWGTDLDPPSSYTLYLDTTSDGSYEYSATYTNDARTRCNATTNYWISDHNYNGTFSVTPPYNSVPVCWTIGTDRTVTNLHWMSGQATQSTGATPWGDTSSTAWAMYVK